MQTIEAAVLVPLGLGLLTLLLMLTFYLHDQTVLTAEYGSMMLDWQHDTDENMGDEETLQKRLQKKTLITEVFLAEQSFGKLIGRLESEETWNVFAQGIKLLSLGGFEETKSRVMIWIKLDACWLKRIWRAAELG